MLSYFALYSGETKCYDPGSFFRRCSAGHRSVSLYDLRIRKEADSSTLADKIPDYYSKTGQFVKYRRKIRLLQIKKTAERRSFSCIPMCLLVAGEAGDGGEAPLQVLVGGDDVAHLAIVVLAVGHHVEVAGTGQADDDVLGLVVLLALHRLVNGHADGVAAFRRGQDALHTGKFFRCGEYARLLHRDRFHGLYYLLVLFLILN